MRPHRNPKKFNAGFRARPAGDFPVYSAHPWASPCGPAFGSSNLFQTNLSAKVTKTIPPEYGPLRGCPARFPRCKVALTALSATHPPPRESPGCTSCAPARSGASRPCVGRANSASCLRPCGLILLSPVLGSHYGCRESQIYLSGSGYQVPGNHRSRSTVFESIRPCFQMGL